MGINTGKNSVVGCGPRMTGSMAIISLIFIISDKQHILPVTEAIEEHIARLGTLGAVLIVLGVYLWMYSVLVDNITKYIKHGVLYIGGIYSYCRNPIYTAWYLIIIGTTMLVTTNYLVFALALILYIYMTFKIKRTEEVWLLEDFGEDYLLYCQRVHRFIPCKSKPFDYDVVFPISQNPELVEEDSVEKEVEVVAEAKPEDTMEDIPVFDDIFQDESAGEDDLEVVDLTADGDDTEEDNEIAVADAEDIVEVLNTEEDTYTTDEDEADTDIDEEELLEEGND